MSELPANQSSAASNFQALRKQGLELIQKLSGQIWTDHNLHDPGITTLEVLCYAINDLSFRSQFPVEDLLRSPNGGELEPSLSGLFPAHEALSNIALTQSDYRKLLTKITGVKNAWLLPRLTTAAHRPTTAEQALYVDKVAEALSLEPNNDLGQPNKKMPLKGLYDVRLELTAHPDWGSLNETALPFVVSNENFAFYKENGSLYLEDDNQTNSQRWARPPNNLNDMAITVVSERTAELNFQGWPRLLVSLASVNAAVTETTWAEFLSNSGILDNFAQKQDAIQRIINKAQAALHDSRNLCEDFASVEPIDAEYIGICCDIEVTAEADLETVQAAVYFAIEQYLSPTLPFYSLSELLTAGHDPDAIFDGPYINPNSIPTQPNNTPCPYTKPGFVLNGDLENTELKQAIYSSDIINAVMDVENVLNIRSLRLRRYTANGEPLGDAEKWCLRIRPRHQAQLSIRDSKILFLKSGYPFNAQFGEFITNLNHLRTVAEKQAYSDIDEQLPSPKGRARDTLSHYPIQHDFPQIYHIGEEGLPANASAAETDNARQFKGYLLFFEQILADYLAQLSNVARLFSLQEDLATSYFSQYLSNIAGTEGAFDDEFYIDPNLVADEQRRAAVRESKDEFIQRRTRLLDHLLARFAERFTDNVMLMVSNDSSLRSPEALMMDRIRFLQEQPLLSRERQRAFNYQLPSWNNRNVSGLQKRVARLAGIENYSQRDLQTGIPSASDEEGFYVIEHILLRPRRAWSALLNQCIEPQQHCHNEDPYSFKVSILFPSWPRRYSDPNFRQYLENLLQQQAPAHVLLKICWLDATSFSGLQNKYQDWLAQLPQDFDNQALVHSQNQLVEVLNNLTTDYPESQLHDCNDDQSGAAVSLGSTNLGATDT